MENRYALITGATSGIGYELAKLFAKDGYNLIIVSRTRADLDRTSKELQDNYGIHVTAIAKDLFHPDAAEELYTEVTSTGLQIDVLVNDAGQGQYGLFVENDIQRLVDIIQLNVTSFTALNYFFLKDMVKRNSGKILNLASIASETPGPYQAVYHATKAYVLSLTEALISENKESAVTITALQPGVTNTDFFNKADMNSSKAVQDKSKMADPADVARDGYDALMKGDDKVVSGIKNKIQTTLANIIPESMLADQVKKQQEPVSSDHK